MSFEERARVAGQARAASMTSDSQRAAANAAHTPAALARRIVRKWNTKGAGAMTRAERAELREILREAKGLMDE